MWVIRVGQIPIFCQEMCSEPLKCFPVSSSQNCQTLPPIGRGREYRPKLALAPCFWEVAIQTLAKSLPFLEKMYIFFNLFVTIMSREPKQVAIYFRIFFSSYHVGYKRYKRFGEEKKGRDTLFNMVK